MEILDTRQLAERKAELETLRDKLQDARDERQNFEGSPMATAAETQALTNNINLILAEYGEDEQEELAELEALETNVHNFHEGAALIREDDFTEYAEHYAEETAGIPDSKAWPCTCIDWDKAAAELLQDFSQTTFQGVSYRFQS